jgi:4,5-DOPA dioxygenase extradiol
MMMPVLFLSHGAPTLPLEAGETGAAWSALAAQLPRPSAILVVSAHWESHIPTVSRAVQPETIHDFSGFPEELYRLQYPAPGAPQLADEVAELLQRAHIAVQFDPSHGLDHGAWVPLSIMFPQADIPVAQLSLQPERDPAWHLEVGRALRPLREQGVLILGSGAITHNLPAVFRHPQGAAAPEWVTAFRDWIAARIREGDLDALRAYRTLAPHAVQNHPTDEHLLPLFVAMGAAAKLEDARHLNPVMTFGLLAMDAWLFDAVR